MGLILTFLPSSVFLFDLLLRLLLTGGNVNSCNTFTYVPGLRHVFGSVNLSVWAAESKSIRAQVSLVSIAYPRGNTAAKWTDTNGERRAMKTMLKCALLVGALLACTNPVAPGSKQMGDPPIRTEPPSVPSTF
jgi:hypothetical protein